MKKFRCPNCGAECLTIADKCYSGYKGYYNRRTIKRLIARSCTRCFAYYLLKIKRPLAYTLYQLVIFTAPFIICILFDVNKVGFIICYLLSMLFFVPLISVDLGNVLFANFIIYDKELDIRIPPMPNGSVIITKSMRRIYKLDVYGAKFFKDIESTIEQDKFRKEFTDGLVPILFHERGKNQPINITILRKEYVPTELIYEGSEFVLIDNGKEIASGYISSTTY